MKAKLSTSDPSDWFVYWRDDKGKLIKKRAGINRHKSLRKRREEGKLLCDYINKLLASGSLRKQTAKDILDKIVQDKKGSLRRRSWQSYKYAADMLTAWLEPDTTMEEITKSVAREFVDHLIGKGYKGKTINGVRGFLTALFNHYSDRNEGYVNPFKGTPKQLQESGRNVAFTDDQMQDVWNKLDPNLRLFTKFIYFTYIRPIELLRLKVSDIRMDIGEIIIQGHQSKNKRQQSVVIPDVFLQEIKAMGYDKMPSDWYLFGRGLTPGIRSVGRNVVSMAHSKVLRDMGYHSDLTLYSWKHTGVVQAYRKGIDIYSIMRQLRHHSLEMTQIYLKSLGLVRNEQFGRLMS